MRILNSLGDENEWLVQYCKRKLEQQHYDYFVFGHRAPCLWKLLLNRINLPIKFLGDWILILPYGEFEDRSLSLKNLRLGQRKVIGVF